MNLGKNIGLLLAPLLPLAVATTCLAQPAQKEEASTFLKEFYVQYFHASYPVTLWGQLKKLQRSYCTPAAYKLARFADSVGEDYLTKNYDFSKESLSTLAVANTQEPNIFLVSYDALGPYTNNPATLVKIHVVIKVELAEVGKAWKIAKVY